MTIFLTAMMQGTFSIRHLDEEEMSLLIDMASKEGWNPGLCDAGTFFRTDPKGFWVGELDGKPIAYISCVTYNDSYAFVGLYIVSEPYRGQGFGYRLWKHVLKGLGDIPCGLDGVSAQIENYKKSGFVYAFRQMRLASSAISAIPNKIIQKLGPTVVDQILAYDARVFGTERTTFVEQWLSMKNATAFYVRGKDGIAGYAVIRQCQEGYKIGPLFADDPTTAEQLFLACHGSVEVGETVYIDMPETNPSTQLWMQHYGLQLVFETARMYKNGTPLFPLDCVYAVSSFELG